MWKMLVFILLFFLFTWNTNLEKIQDSSILNEGFFTTFD